MGSDDDPDSYSCYLEVYFKTAELAPSHVQLLMLCGHTDTTVRAFVHEINIITV